MWFILPIPYRTQFVLLFATLMFVGYGVKEINEAREYGTSTRDGVEAILISLVPFSLLVLVTWNKHRRRLRR
jgi:hypothetical protein